MKEDVVLEETRSFRTEVSEVCKDGEFEEVEGTFKVEGEGEFLHKTVILKAQKPINFISVTVEVDREKT